MMKFIEKIELKDEIVDNDNHFSIGYFEELNIYIMKIVVSWIAWYDRFYKITEEDYILYETDKDSFYKKYDKEISQDSDVCFSGNFMGATALRDYDGVKGFQYCYPSPEKNSFQHFYYEDGIFYANIVWEHAQIVIPPRQDILKEDGFHDFPLRKQCKLFYDLENNPICYCKDITL